MGAAKVILAGIMIETKNRLSIPDVAQRHENFSLYEELFVKGENKPPTPWYRNCGTTREEW